VIRDGALFGLMVAAALTLGAAAGLSCYDTSKPAPPCTVSGGDGCYPLVHDAKKQDGGR